MRSCKTCKWAHTDTWSVTECRFPVPAWLLATVRGLDASRENRLGDRLLPNESDSDQPYTNCPTWESAA